VSVACCRGAVFVNACPVPADSFPFKLGVCVVLAARQ